ncbi:MAG: threonine synthase [Clostridia bacterium]|nr:threonine synthase [Clostridia bacterium]
MKYVSTRDNNKSVSSSFAIAHGISEEGGLFLPETIPALNADEFSKLCNMKYTERAEYILGKFLTDFTEDEIDYCVAGAYSGSFEKNNPAPLVPLGDNVEMLELWHGPTCAFKDLALQLLPYLMVTAAKKQSDGKNIVILVATSGDTGKAALEGFRDVENTEIIVFYPCDGVSPMQKLQMTTQAGKNVHVYGIKGNFDDAQSGVKTLFTDENVKAVLSKHGFEFSSANSINWGRLAPQIVYYISAYCDMINQGRDLSGGFNVVVPTGNFGNILAAYYAKAMGTPIKKLICASNKNNVLTDFINTGIYDKNREFYTTISPSMDILISSNLERMLYILSGGNAKYVTALENLLKETGKFEISEDMKEKSASVFYGGYCDDEQTLKTISDTFREYGYLLDTHTAVALRVYENYVDETGDKTTTVIASTASPYKFPKSVLSAIQKDVPAEDFEAAYKLSEITNVTIPQQILELKNANLRFNDVICKNDLKDAVFSSLGI